MLAFHIFFLLLVLVHVTVTNSQNPVIKPPRDFIICEVGFGQRGASYDEKQSWFRMCYDTHYCWRAHADRTHYQQMKNMFVFPWNEFYEEYYLLGCGGYLGSSKEDPWRPLYPLEGYPEGYGTRLDHWDINATAPVSVRTPGDSIQLEIDYTCTYNYCSAAAGRTVGMTSFLLALIGSFLLF
jgi:hypothetical protein